MFTAALFTIFPYKQKSRSNHQDRLKAKFKTDPPTGEALEDEDIKCLNEEANLIRFETIPFFKILFFCTFCCKRNRKTRLFKKTVKNIERQLDIRSLIKTRIDISILTRLLLNRKQ